MESVDARIIRFDRRAERGCHALERLVGLPRCRRYERDHQRADQRYALDSSDADLRRLLKIAELSAEPTRTAFHGIGVRPGWRVIDCGCGPLGALAVMAEMVAPDGQVVGIDFSEAAVQRARSLVSTVGLENTEVRVVMSTTSMGRRWEARWTSHTPGAS